MRYNFDEVIDRHNTASLKWDGRGDTPEVIQLWVADMDFKTAPEIIDALKRRADHGVFGYVSVPERYYDAIVNWNQRRHGWTIDRNRILCTTGVVPAVSVVIKALVKPGDGVILQTPAYNCFFRVIRNTKTLLAENPLKREETENGFSYDIYFDHLERLAAIPSNKVLILCNPHNPSGRVWTPDELRRISEICHRHDVRVISDEIHCELVHPGSHPYTPYATIDPDAIVCNSPSKAFNIAGLLNAFIVCPDAETQERIAQAIEVDGVGEMNPFGVEGLMAAYDECGDWLDELNEYLKGNFDLLREFFKTNFPGFKVCDSEATYLSWIDVSASGMTGDEVADKLLTEAKVRVSSGSIYGEPNSIRLNFACPRPVLDEAFRRMASCLNK